MGSVNKLRAFLAIELDAPSMDYLGRISSRLKVSQADVSWVNTRNAHLTLKFLGDISPETLLSVNRILSLVFGEQKPFKLRLEGVGVFPGLERPRVVWVGVRDESGMLGRLFERSESAFESIGFPRENRPFNPHLTLGRVRSSSGKMALVKAVMDSSRQIGPTLEVNHAVLFRSDLKPTGAVYTALQRFDFDSENRK